MAARMGISLLPTELVWEIGKNILANDVVDYISFRAACSEFRSSLPDPRNLNFCFLPQNYIMLYQRADAGTHNSCDVFLYNKKKEYKNTELDRSFIHLPTGNHFNLVLPELRTHSILSATVGLLILADKQTRAMCLYNPLTRALSADLPPTLPMKDEEFSAVITVAPSSSTVDQPTLMVALYYNNVAYFVKPGESFSIRVYLPFYITSALYFKGCFYCTDVYGSIWGIEPEKELLTHVFSQDVATKCWDLAQIGPEMLLIESNPVLEGRIKDASHNLCVYRVDLSAGTIIPTNDLGNYAIFVGDTANRQQVLSVIPKNNLIERNSIYVCCRGYYLYRLKDRSTEFTKHPVDKYCYHISRHCNKWHYWYV